MSSKPETSLKIPMDRALLFGRIRSLCDSLFRGDETEMAKKARVNLAVLRDIIKNRPVREDQLQHAIKRICCLKSVSGLWVRTGQGEPLHRAGEMYEAQTIQLHDPGQAESSFNQEGLLRKDVRRHEREQAMSQQATNLDLFASMVERVKKIEETVKQRAVGADLIPSRIDELQKKYDALQTAFKTVRDSFENRCTELDRVIKEQGIQGAESERRLNRMESAMLALRGDFDGVMEELKTVQDALTAPGQTGQSPDRNTDDEESMWDDECVTISAYVALRGPIPAKFRSWNLPRQTIANYIDSLEMSQRLPVVKSEDGKNKAHAYRVSSFRYLAEFIECHKGRMPKENGVRQFVDFVFESNGNH